jgi:hypothetical protein
MTAEVSTGGFSHRTAARHGEVRWPASVAIVLAATSHAILPSSLLILPRWLIPAIEVVLLISLVVVNPHRLTVETRWSRMASLVLAAVIIVANSLALGFLIKQLTSDHSVGGRELLLSALQVLLTNVIAFALVYWELDRGGAVARLPSSARTVAKADFVFPQDDPATAQLALGVADERWIPVFTDYLYLSVTNSTAYSPTDTLPISTRAKALMAVQSLAALITTLLAIARAVNILK